MTRKFFTRIAFAVLLLQLFACRKPVEPVGKKEPLSRPPTDDYRDCQITKIIARGRYSFEIRTGVVNYWAGNPTGVTFDTCYTYHPQIEFRYDAEGRLTDYIAPLAGCGGGDYFEAWYQYRYDSRDRIVGDTLVKWGRNIGGVPVHNPGISDKSFATYEYDDQDRIKTVTRTDSRRLDVTRDEYVYNTNGNRALRLRYYNGVRSSVELYGPYDNKVNFLRTHRVWMFVNRDYSLNNQITASSYSALNLPTKIRLESYYDYPFLHGVYIDQADIVYRCRPAY